MLIVGGYEVRFQHNVEGGVSAATIRDTLTDMRSTGLAYCHPNDQFNYRTARKVALKWAMSQWPRPHRAFFWTEYAKVRPQDMRT